MTTKKDRHPQKRISTLKTLVKECKGHYMEDVSTNLLAKLLVAFNNCEDHWQVAEENKDYINALVAHCGKSVKRRPNCREAIVRCRALADALSSTHAYVLGYKKEPAPDAIIQQVSKALLDMQSCNLSEEEEIILDVGYCLPLRINAILACDFIKREQKKKERGVEHEMQNLRTADKAKLAH